MHVDVRQAAHEVIIVDLEGKLVRGRGADLLSDVLSELFESGWRKILLNLTEVNLMDSSGVGELVAGLRTAGEVGAKIKILRLADRVERTLKMSQILPLFEIFRDEEEAVASFSG